MPFPDAGKMKLIFGADTLKISYGARATKRRWRLNSTAEILYFDPIAEDNHRDWAWHVKQAGDSLIIDRRILFKEVEVGLDSGEKIIFEKVQ